MALVIKHTKVSAIPDGSDPSLVLPSDWNADHSLAGVADIAQGGTGQTTANAALNALLPTQTGQATKVLTTDGTNTTWAAGGGGLTGKTQSATPFVTALGTGAGASTGTNGTFIGYNAGNAAQTGISNTVVGSDAFNSAGAAQNTVAMGWQAGKSLTGGNFNTFVGSQSGRLNVNGNNNTFLGYQAGEVSTGSNNTFIGTGAGGQATNLGVSVAIGGGCLGAASSVVDGSTAVGYSALNQLSSGVGCTALGYFAGEGLQTGARNTIVGYQALSVSIAGADNATLGYQAGRLSTGNNNTLIGSSSGGALTTGASNTLIGKGAGSAITTGANNTIIGTYAGTAALTGATVLSNGAGFIRALFNSSGALSFEGTDFGFAGAILKSQGTAGAPVWGRANVISTLNVNATYTISPADPYSLFFCDATTASFTITLPPAAGATGLTYTIKRTDSANLNTLTVASQGGLIEGLTTQSIGVSVGATYCSDGTNWWEISNA